MGESGTILTSSDGTTWTSRTSGTTISLNDAEYGSDSFFVVGGRSSPATVPILKSNDGITWNQVSTISDSLYSIHYQNSIYIAASLNGHIFTSSDGSSWTNRATNVTDGLLKSIAYGKSKYVIVGGYKTIVTSPNYISWTRTSYEGPGTTSYNDIVYSDDKFVLVGNSGTILTSTDGTTWTSRTSGTSNNLNSVFSKE